MLWGAVSEAVLIIANIGTATFLWPVLKRQHESLAMSYVAARIMESVFIAVGVLSVLTVVTLRQGYAGADAGAAAGLTVGRRRLPQAAGVDVRRSDRPSWSESATESSWAT